MRKVLISTSSFGQVSRQPLEMLEAAGATYELNPYGRKLQPEESVELLKDVEGLVAGTESLDRNVLSGASKLKVISRCGVGIDNVDLEAAGQRGIQVFNTPDAHVDGVAELTLAGLLDVLRGVSLADRSIRAGQWTRPMGSLLRGKVIGIIGLGRVGKRLVQLLEPFETTVLAYDVQRDLEFAHRFRVRYCPLDEALSAADIVSLHLPFTEESRHLLNRSRLECLKPGAVVVNCDRGGLVDEEALHDLIASGKLAGAYLDTFEREPYSGPLSNLDNVVLTPHIGSYAAECRAKMEVQAVENLLRGFEAADG